MKPHYKDIIQCTEDESSRLIKYTLQCSWGIFIPLLYIHLQTYWHRLWVETSCLGISADRVFPAAQSDVLNNNGSAEKPRRRSARLLNSHQTHTERDEMTKTDVSAAFIIFQYSGCVTRPSSCSAVSMFLMAWNRKQSKCWVHAILHLLRQRCQTEWTDYLTECRMISLQHPGECLSRLRRQVFNHAELIKDATCNILTSINL